MKTLSMARLPRTLGAAATRPGLLLAFAGLVVTNPVFAQSSVSIYGIVDQGLAKANSGTTPGSMLPGRGAASDVLTMKAGNTSRIGFRGREDLGNDAYARFQFEHRFAADTGASSNANVFWLGRSVVALGSKQWGELYAGREYSPAFWVALNADPTSWSYVSQLGGTYTYANYTPVEATVESSNIRWNNSLGYKSPDMAGFTFEVATALGEGVRKKSTSGNAQYKTSQLWFGVAFDRLDADNNLALAAAGYDFGVVFPKLSYSRAKGGVNGDAKSYSLSALVPTGFGRAYASFGSHRPAAGLNAKMIGAGVQYDLSKRTLLYTNLGSALRDGSTRTTAVDVGIKHSF
ncbi:porin [Hydrogenophaga sp. A37]|uniref:porin n=1 Tax=Hydrogenophaga sp. A37 TaxID=1945864 RepID=UPI00209B709E|nr:porin [Hydrogenophaga sp. A37]